MLLMLITESSGERASGDTDDDNDSDYDELIDVSKQNKTGKTGGSTAWVSRRPRCKQSQ